MSKLKKSIPKPIKILLVDDDATLRRVYEMQFEAYPEYRLLAAENTLEAERMIRKEKPALILLDLILAKRKGVPVSQMNKIHGFNFLTFLKMEPRYAQTPVVIFSNLDSPQDIDRARKTGAADYLVKAKFLPSEVIREVGQVLERERAKAAFRRIKRRK